MERRALNVTLTFKQAGVLYSGLLNVLDREGSLDSDDEILATFLGEFLRKDNDLQSVHVDQLTLMEVTE
jgi:hypothetical protein